jgi:hypothetical protein
LVAFATVVSNTADAIGAALLAHDVLAAGFHPCAANTCYCIQLVLFAAAFIAYGRFVIAPL